MENRLRGMSLAKGGSVKMVKWLIKIERNNLIKDRYNNYIGGVT